MASTTIPYSTSGYNGLFDWLGKDKGTTTWAHPETTRAHCVTSCQRDYTSAGYESENALNQGSSDFIAGNGYVLNTVADDWAVDFGADATVTLTHLAIKGRTSGSNRPSNFIVQGSRTGAYWETLLTVSSDTSIGSGTWGDFAVTDAPACRLIRIVVTGPDQSVTSNVLEFADIEFYGSYVDGVGASTPTSLYLDRFTGEDIVSVGAGFRGLVGLVNRGGWPVADATPSTITATSSSTYGSEGPDEAVDEDAANRFASNSEANPWFKIDAGSGEAWLVEEMALHAKTGPPSNFTIHGSNNDSDWDELLVVTSDPPPANDWNYYTIETDTRYRYFRLTMNDTGYLIFTAIEFYGFSGEPFELGGGGGGAAGGVLVLGAG